jgi:hypothetical protein
MLQEQLETANKEKFTAINDSNILIRSFVDDQKSLMDDKNRLINEKNELVGQLRELYDRYYSATQFLSGLPALDPHAVNIADAAGI